MKTNRDKLIRTLVAGAIRPPLLPERWEVSHDGTPELLTGCGSIVYNVRVGDTAYGWAADHLEPGASTHNADEKERMIYYNLPCIGNRVEVISGKAEGAVGYVVAKHAGAWHIVVDFAEEDLRRMRLKDAVQVEVYGSGLKLTDYPDVHLTSIDPGILDALHIEERDGQLIVPVAGVVPPELMGSGLGSTRPMGDVDFMTSDWQAVEEAGLDQIRLGDVVLVRDLDASYGLSYKRGAASVGVIVHGDSPTSGHGPGVTFFLSSAKPIIQPRIDPSSNVGKHHEAAYGPLKPLAVKP
jgi:hypothetical protein